VVVVVVVVTTCDYYYSSIYYGTPATMTDNLDILFVIFFYLRSLVFRPATDPQLVRWRAATTTGPAAADGGGVGGDACAVAAARDV